MAPAPARLAFPARRANGAGHYVGGKVLAEVRGRRALHFGKVEIMIGQHTPFVHLD